MSYHHSSHQQYILSGHHHSSRYRHRRTEGVNGHRHPERDISNLQVHKYHALDLTRMLIVQAGSDLETNLTREEYAFLRSPICRPHSIKSLKRFTQQWIPLLDKLFFLNAVQPVLRGVRFKDKVPERHGRLMAAYYRSGVRTITMTVSDDFERPEDYVSFFVHEMLHAFQQIYRCDCISCRVSDRGAEMFGKGGHGAVWADTMIAIQNSLNLGVVNLFDCRISLAVTAEIMKSRWQPDEGQLMKWGVVLDEGTELDGLYGDEEEYLVDEESGEFVEIRFCSVM